MAASPAPHCDAPVPAASMATITDQSLDPACDVLQLFRQPEQAAKQLVHLTF